MSLQDILETMANEQEDGNAITVKGIQNNNAKVVLGDDQSVRLYSYDTASREGVNVSGAKLGFHGVTPVVQAAHIADPAGGVTVDAEARAAINSILVVLENLGLKASA